MIPLCCICPVCGKTLEVVEHLTGLSPALLYPNHWVSPSVFPTLCPTTWRPVEAAPPA